MPSVALRLLLAHVLSTAALPASRLAGLAPLGGANKLDYCSLCEPPGTHTLCTFAPGPGANCSGYRAAPLSDAEKRTILRTHNVVRSRVANGLSWAKTSRFGPQPRAANMHQLYWDEELAAIAQRWADRCLSFYTTTPHDACRDTFRFPVGQNIVTTAFSKPVASDVRARCLDWYGELLFFDPQWVHRFAPNPDPDPVKQIGHYTQMVWGWTYAIGCARVVFTEQFRGERKPWTIERLVCNYAPSGNYLGEFVYKVGQPCSACPNGTVCSKRYPGLCSVAARTEKEDSTSRERKAALQTENRGPSKPHDHSSALPDLFNLAAFLPLSWRSAAFTPVDAPPPSERAVEEAAILAETEALENGTRRSEAFTLAYAEPSGEAYSAHVGDEAIEPDENEEKSASIHDRSEEASVSTDSSSQSWRFSSSPGGSTELASEIDREQTNRGLFYYGYHGEHESF